MTSLQKKYDFKNVPLDDQKTWDLFAKGDTLGVFQLEKQLGQDWSKKVKPSNIEELSDLIALLRPSCLGSGMSERYARIKNGEEEPSYIHDSLIPILEPTKSIFIYQETTLEICKIIAGFNEVEADLCRRAVGKKKADEMTKVKAMFIEGAEKKGTVNKNIADEIFGWIQASVRYQFGKSHSVGYALISYYSAYQKANYPKEFYTSWLTYSNWKPNPREEVYNLVQNAKLNNVEITPPDIRRKNTDFTLLPDGEIIFGLSHIRGVGPKAIDKIQKKKIDKFEDLLKNKLNRSIVEGLIKSGACDCYGMSRAYMLRCLHAILGQSDKQDLDMYDEIRKLSPKELIYFYDNINSYGIKGTLEKIVENNICISKRREIIEKKIKFLNYQVEDNNRNKSTWEKLYLGLNLTCSAADDVDKLERTQDCKDIINIDDKTSFVAHVVIDAIHNKRTKTGNAYCYLTVSDNTMAINPIIVWPKTFDHTKEFLKENVVVTIYGHKDSWNNKQQFIADQIKIIG